MQTSQQFADSSFRMFRSNTKSNRYDKGVSVASGKEFVRLHKACCRSLEAFCEDSQQALNAMILAELLPNDIGKQIALDFHLKAEIRAKHIYERERGNLSDFLQSRVEVSVAKKPLRKRRPKKS